LGLKSGTIIIQNKIIAWNENNYLQISNKKSKKLKGSTKESS